MVMKKFGLKINDESHGNREEQKVIDMKGVSLIALEFAQAFPEYYGLWTKDEMEKFNPERAKFRLMAEKRDYSMPLGFW